MKITIETDTNIQETEVKIRCNSITPNIEKIISTLNVFEKRLTVKKDNEIFFINISEVIYIDTVDKKTFVYTRDNVRAKKIALDTKDFQNGSYFIDMYDMNGNRSVKQFSIQ